jgi:hypothetical protein
LLLFVNASVFLCILLLTCFNSLLFDHITCRVVSFFFSNVEVLFGAEQQLEAAGGIADTLFAAIKVTIDAESKPLVEAWQVGRQLSIS